MGRMALTNYLLATALILGRSPLLGIDGLEDWPAGEEDRRHGRETTRGAHYRRPSAPTVFVPESSSR